MDSPEQRRDAVITAAITAGASVLSTTPMATVADPHSIIAYDVRFGAPDPDVLAALVSVRAETEIDMSGLVPWTPEEVEDAPFDAE